MNRNYKKEAIEIFTNNVLWLRKKNNLSQKEMAKIMEVSLNTLKKIEQGILPSRLGVDVLFNIQNYFAIPPKVFMDKKF